MRPIKFRVWDGKKMDYDPTVWSSHEDGECWVNDAIGVQQELGVIFMQYVGLKDKTGVELDWWEGDLFKHHYCDYPLEIVFEQGCYWFKAVGTNVKYSLNFLLNVVELPKKIGNIHENPELLGK